MEFRRGLACLNSKSLIFTEEKLGMFHFLVFMVVTLVEVKDCTILFQIQIDKLLANTLKHKKR